MYKLSLRAGLSRNAVREIETHADRAPDVNTAAALATALGVDFEWLATGNGEAPKSTLPPLRSGRPHKPRKATRKVA